ncbi:MULTISPECIES: Asp-tRNA(Asn)/Glu-tRNA(Gln) amidotransferase subunit GatC [Holzapfeliella]|uniref:Aspartyl/glutamyl-tRNA(Asn/Gln) amidotransferase subunit C n=1 Tax=Holzapfeliella saturejae TaxID=3082953 RepID=A0ABU8SHC2_9LACO
MISKEEIAHVAALSRLKFSEEELEMFTPQMDEIIAMAGQLQEVDTTDVVPTNLIVDEENVFRNDEVEKMQTREELLKNVPETKDGLIRVPSIIDKEDDNQ